MPQPIHGGQSQPCAISALSTSTWVLRLRLGPPGAAQPSHCSPLPSPGQQNGSHSLLIQGTFVALSQSSLCKGPSRLCLCWVFKSRRGVAASRTWDKVTGSNLLSGKLVRRERSSSFGAQVQCLQDTAFLGRMPAAVGRRGRTLSCF